tara:strand:- start:470 stop:706 length:237 start_codon:yes stop_codon:yes gene_type:complete
MSSNKVIRVEIKPKYADEPLERMIKRFSKKVKKERIIEKVLERRYFEKNSDKKRRLEKKRKRVLDKLKRKHSQNLDRR